MKKIVASLLLPLLAVPIWAVKAKPGVVEYVQADGSVVKLRLHGDESFHYATTPEDALLIINNEGTYEYAIEDKDGKPSFSGVPASQPVGRALDKRRLISGASFSNSLSREAQGRGAKGKFSTRSADSGAKAKYRYSTSAFPTVGEPHSLVILVEYQNVGFSMQDPAAYYEDFLNGDNFTANGATGSCRQYYKEASSGVFVPTFDLYGPVKLKNNRAYYGAGNEDNACMMVVEAVEALDHLVDFSQYDHNDDGFVDSVYIIYAGQGENDGGPAESVWPYSWELLEEGIDLSADGVKFNTYGVSNEVNGSRRVDGIGTFTHEFGHVLGLPDLYNTAVSDVSTPEDWSVMDSGSYNNDSRTPPTFSAFERYSLGWLSPEEIYSSGEYSLQNLGDSNRAYIMTTEEKPDEFYMLENRQQSGWDSYLPWHGMLVWHIDFVQRQWDANTVNNNRNHQYVELVRADNLKNTSTFYGDPYPGSRGVTEFSSTTTPALKSWLKFNLNVTSIYDIAENDGLISFSATTSEDRAPAGVDDIPSTSIKIRVDGRTIFVEGGEAAVYDLSGRLVGKVADGASLAMSPGLYIIDRKKIMVR